MTEYEDSKFSRIRLPVQLLVEGKDPKNFFEAMLKDMDVASDIEVRDFGGVNELSGYLRLFVRIQEFSMVKRVGIIRDAEENAVGAFDSVCNSLNAAGLPVPRNREEFTGEVPSVGVAILPGDNQPGMLETLLCKTFADSLEDSCISEFFECVKKSTGQEIVRRDKARTQVFLAKKPRPFLSVGVAAQRKYGYWDFNHSGFDRIRGFLTGLVGKSDVD